jgi:Sulfotransferase domain
LNTLNLDMQNLVGTATSPLMPNVFMIGAAKAGTTFLASLLAQHPMVYLAKPKEPEYFSFDDRYARGFDWYRSLYSAAGQAKWILDASTGYTRYPQYPNSAQRIAEAVPNAKLIYLMRHPVDRAFSHYVHRWSKELHCDEPFRIPFEEHIRTDPMCIQSSDYMLQISRYLKYFSSNSILCLFTHEVKGNSDAVLQRICDFLEIEYLSSYFPRPMGRDNSTSDHVEGQVRIAITNRIKNTPLVGFATTLLPHVVKDVGYRLLRRSVLANAAAAEFTPPPMLAATRLKLIEQFRESNNWVSSFSGADLSCWER